jgi:hypothetical protein
VELLIMTTRPATPVIAPLVALLVVACVPDFTDDTSRIGGARILAVRSLPAEARDGEEVTLEALVASTDPSAEPEISWSLCVDRKPLSELGPVSPRCLATPDPLPDITERIQGTGDTVSTALPGDACRLFGPELPDPKPGEPAGRPVDPDPTGGFYQPFVAWLDGASVLASTRIACRIRDVGFSSRYRRNENPEPTLLEVRRSDGSVVALGTEPVTLARGERVFLRVTWPSCPATGECGDGVCSPEETALPDDTAPSGQASCPADCSTPRGCGGAERYAIFDLGSQQTRLATEALSVSWYASDGEFDGPRTSGLRAVGSSGEPGSENGWTAPRGAARVQLWAVVRDDRGGVAWLSGDVVTED